jgi:hypothetical protein
MLRAQIIVIEPQCPLTGQLPHLPRAIAYAQAHLSAPIFKSTPPLVGSPPRNGDYHERHITDTACCFHVEELPLKQFSRARDRANRVEHIPRGEGVVLRPIKQIISGFSVRSAETHKRAVLTHERPSLNKEIIRANAVDRDTSSIVFNGVRHWGNVKTMLCVACREYREVCICE